MLFLRALLFSLLGASALAIPFHHGISSSAVPAGGAADLTKQGLRQSDGLWYRTKQSVNIALFIPPVSNIDSMASKNPRLDKK